MSNPIIPYRYICIEGNIGSGKTSFCQKLSEEYNCKLILEKFEENPFLPFFYEDKDKYAFPLELFFMTERHKQLEKDLLNQDMFNDFTVADYSFVKTLLFARNNLEGREFRVFQKLFNVLNNDFAKPDIIVYFHRNVDILISNIEKRGRDFERNISHAYLQEIQNAYFEYFRNILTFPVLIIDLDKIDFIANPRHYEDLKYLIQKTWNPGVHRYTLSS